MAYAAVDNYDEPLTPIGRVCVQPQMNQIIFCAVGFKNPIDVDSIKSQLKTSLILSHPRFSSLMVHDSQGLEHWSKTPHIDLDHHVIVLHDPVTTPDVDHETAVNAYLANLSTNSGLSADDKPMWDLHLLMAHNCGVFRIHHALADGISFMSLLLGSFGRAGDKEKLPPMITLASAAGKKRSRSGRNGEKGWWDLVIGFVVPVWFSFIFVVQHLSRILWVCDRKIEISGGHGVELWPRKLATARFKLHDMKLVKKAVPNATINDVLVGVVSSGLSRYLDHRTPNALPAGFQITGTAMANLRKQPELQVFDLMKSNYGSTWGNKFGMFLLPIYYHKSSGADPLEFLKRAKVIMDRKKKSLEAHLLYKVQCFVTTYLGAKVAAWLCYRIFCNTSFCISNVPGPQEEISLGGNPITYLRANISSTPYSLTVLMVSYVERADLQISVARDIIPDPEFLAKCFEDALLDMKDAAVAIIKT